MSSTPVPAHFPEILRQYPLAGRYVSAAPYGSGHIKYTFVVHFDDGRSAP